MKGLSQEQLAKKSDTSTGYIWRIEKGSRIPSFPTLKKITDVLEIPLKSLFEELEVIIKKDKLDDKIMALLKNKPRSYKERAYKILKALK